MAVAMDLFLRIFLLYFSVDAFVIRLSTHHRAKNCVVLRATLSERQIQFWEDVEDGLNELEEVYGPRGLSMDRMREFGRSARGDVDPPQGLLPYHEPSEENVLGLTARPFWDDVAADTERFPWAAQLEANYETIWNEFRAQMERSNDNFCAGDSAWQNQVMGEGWSAFRLQRLGVWNLDNCVKFPKTYDLLKRLDIPLAVRGVCFARQAAGSGVASHSDGRNFILTAHLGLKIPTDCYIEVGGERRTWTEGKITMVDTSFSHSTGNASDDDRYVLIIDFWHPELSEAERAGLELVYDLRNKFESGQVPVRPPRGTLYENESVDSGGGWWTTLMGGGN